jgi:hypothetical protein
MIEIFCLVLAGAVIGVAFKTERDGQRYNKTLEQVDKQVRDDLAYYRNLSESLKQDLHWAKFYLAQERKKQSDK